ncbi:MAG TPA: GntR family transcriptional regulator [Bryobacteraceae bacterium]|nr:GntR family transcriptional regulator [Bryobacteraceae bacterium]
MKQALPPLRIDLGSPVPVYRQIVDTLRALLVSGDLQPGDPLPPVRQIALALGIHFNTVAEAYRILADEGWLDLKRRRGAVVIERQPARPLQPTADKASFSRRMRELVAEVQSKGLPPKFIARELRLLAEAVDQ